MTHFSESRDVELSIIYYLETEIGGSWSGVNVVKSFTNAYKTALPVVCIRLNNITHNNLEIGDNTLLDTHTITIDLFCESAGQRIDLADFIVDKLKDGCVFYDFSRTVGDPDNLTKSVIGRLRVGRFLSDNMLDFGEDSDKYDQHRHLIECEVMTGHA